MAKYRLKSGFHTQIEYRPATEEEVEYEEVATVVRRGKHWVLGKRQYSAGDPANNVVESDEDLIKKCPNKFELLSASHYVGNPWDDLDKMSVKQLEAFAVSQEIDLGDTKGMSKKEIVKSLKISAGLIKEELDKSKDKSAEDKPHMIIRKDMSSADIRGMRKPELIELANERGLEVDDTWTVEELKGVLIDEDAE